MSSPPANILIFGATGLIGSHITSAIVSAKENFRSIAIFTSSDTISRKSAIIDHLEEQGVAIIVGDLTSEEDVNRAYNGIDTVVSCVGRAAIISQLKLIELADKHPDVRRFLPSEYGTDIEYGPSSADEKPHQQKLKVRALLKTTKHLDHTYVVTGPYGDAQPMMYLSAMSPDLEGLGTYDVARKRAVVIDDGNGKISVTTMRDAGKFVAATLLHVEAARNRALHVNSFTATPRQIVAEFERQTGDSWEVSETSLDQLKKLEDEAWAKEQSFASIATLRRIWAEGGTLYDERDNSVIGMEEKVDTLTSAVEQAIRVQKESSST